MEPRFNFLLADSAQAYMDSVSSILLKMEPSANLKTFAYGREVIRYLVAAGAANFPRAVIMEYNMPNGSGPEVVEWMASRTWFDGVHRFVWSSTADPYYAERCRQLGCTEYFEKPDNETVLTELVTKLIEYCR